MPAGRVGVAAALQRWSKLGGTSSQAVRWAAGMPLKKQLTPMRVPLGFSSA